MAAFPSSLLHFPIPLPVRLAICIATTPHIPAKISQMGPGLCAIPECAIRNLTMPEGLIRFNYPLLVPTHALIHFRNVSIHCSPDADPLARTERTTSLTDSHL